MKLGRLIIDVNGVELSAEEAEILSHPYIGGVIIFSKNFESNEQLKNLINSIKKIRSPSLLIYIDQEGGSVQRIKSNILEIPSVSNIGKIYENDNLLAKELARSIGWLIGHELSFFNIDINTCPVLDIDYKKSKVVSDRCYSANPAIVSQLAHEYILGAKENNISSIGKHYPGHGYAIADSHYELPIDNREYKTIFSNDLDPYIYCIEKGLNGVMLSHVQYKKIDNLPASLSKIWIYKLRNELRYNGIIYSDDLSMKALDDFGSMEDRVEHTISAGCDCLFICNNQDSVVKVLDNVIINDNQEIHTKLNNMRTKQISYDDFSNSTLRREIISRAQHLHENLQLEIKL